MFAKLITSAATCASFSTCRIRGWYRPVVSSINVDRVRDRRGVVAGIRHAAIVVTKVLLLLLIKMTTCRVSLDVIAAVHLCDFARRCVRGSSRIDLDLPW